MPGIKRAFFLSCIYNKSDINNIQLEHCFEQLMQLFLRLGQLDTKLKNTEYIFALHQPGSPPDFT